MIQIFLNLFLFHSLISDKARAIISPTQNKKNQMIKLTIIFSLIFIIQYQLYVKNKEPNYYEILELNSHNIDSYELTDQYNKIKQKTYNDKLKQKLNKAFECLKFSFCRQQYIKYGSFQKEMVKQQMSQMSENVDWRMGASLIFYIPYGLLAASLASIEQKPGIRISMALAVVFCLNDFQMLMKIKNDQDEAELNQPNIFEQTLMPNIYCVFEKIHIMQLIYLYSFNIICMISTIYGVDQHKQKINRIQKLINNQIDIKSNLKELYSIQKDGITYNLRQVKKQLKEKNTEWTSDLQKKQQSLLQNISEEQAEQKKKRNQLIKKIIFGIIGVIILYRNFA